jgi:hypothetical protein
MPNTQDATTQLASPNGLDKPAPKERDAIDIVAEAYDAAMSDPAVYTSRDAAQHIIRALEAAGHWPSRRRPTSLDFNGQREIEWTDVEMALNAIDAIAVNVEMVGRCAVDSVHAERLDGVFDSLRAGLEEHVANLEKLLGLKEWRHE